MNDRYLISAVKLRSAFETAMKMGLKRFDWVYIPWEYNERRKKIMGQRVGDFKFLIGSFSDEEKEYLLASNWNRVECD
jgi:hypothetical protein